MKRNIKHGDVSMVFFRDHWVEVSNVEAVKRHRTMMPLTLDKESRAFFERILDVKRDHEPVFITNKESKGR